MKSKAYPFFAISIMVLIFSSALVYSQEEVWDLAWEKNTAKSLHSVIISHDGKLTIAGDGYGLIKAWNTENGNLVWDCVVPGQVDELLFSPDGSRLISRGGTLNEIDSKNGNVIRNIPIQSNEFINCAKFSPDGKKLAIGVMHYVKVFDMVLNVEIFSGDAYWVSSVDISNDGTKIVSGDFENNFKFWDITTSQLLWTKKHDQSIRSVAFSPDGKNAVSSDYYGLFENWDLQTGTRNWITSIGGGSLHTFYTPDGSKIITGGQGQCLVQALDAKNGTILWSQKHSSVINYLSMDSEAKSIISASHNNIKILELNTGKVLLSVNISDCEVRDVKFSSDRNKIAASGSTSTYSGKLFVWNYTRSINILSPENNEKVKANSNYKIKWSSKNVSSIKLEYSTDNGTNWTLINNSITASLGEYNWLVPIIESTQCKIRIRDIEDPTIMNTIDSSFEIYRPVKILTPIGGEVWQAGIFHDIKWINKTTSVLTIEYSLDNGANWYVINNTLQPTSNTFQWIVTNSSSSQCKIRIYDPNDLVNKDESSTTFDIFQSLKITSPNGGEVLFTKRTKQITWKNINTDWIKILYTTDSGSNWTLIADNVNASEGKYFWVVPEITANKTKIVIMDNSNSNVYDESDDYFTIVQPSIIVTNPTGGETLMANSKCEISWLSQYVDNVKIEYTTDNGIIWSKIGESISASLKKYTWKVPNISENKVKIRISDSFDNETKGESKGTFSICLTPELLILSPNGGEVFKAGKESKILWTGTNSTTIAIFYTKDKGNSWILICDSISTSLGQYNWTIPSLTSNECRVKLVDKLFPDFFDLSDTTFSIIQPSITVLSPNGGEKWMAKTKNDITWSSSFVSKVNIDFSTDNGKTWYYIDENIAAENRKYTWPTLDVVGDKFRIRISDSADMQVFSMSEKPFLITPFVGINNEEISEMPTKFVLSQNYPNPFNPETTISYAIPKSEHVLLKVYDQLGKEVATLVDEYKQAGTYNSQFFIRNYQLPSGVYFYRLQAGSYNEAKKMIILK